jgi:serine/threonine-protein kinase
MALGQIGKYERLDVLGHGASGIVYLAKDMLLGRQVALKQISAQGEERERVLGEARVLDRLRHRNIVQVHNVDQIEGKILIDMEYIRGRNLQDILREQPQLSLEQAVSITVQICEGLAFAHANRTVHRDVKPANIIISHQGVVKLVDFGLAEVLGTNSFAGGAGTYAYMAPEDFHGEEQSDRRSDIWAAGVILYEMLTGVRPFRPAKVKDPFSWKKAIEEDPIKPVFNIRPDIPAEIDQIIAHALARSKSERYDDAEIMAGDLRRLGVIGDDAEDQVAALLDKHPSYRRESAM